MKNLLAAQLFGSYKVKSDMLIDLLNKRRPAIISDCTKKSFERDCILAEFWAEVATKLSGNKVNYVEKWRTGK